MRTDINEGAGKRLETLDHALLLVTSKDGLVTIVLMNNNKVVFVHYK